jgi:Bacterial Ig domain
VSLVRLSHVGRAALFLSILVVADLGCAGRRDDSSALRGGNQPPLGVIESPREGATALRSFTVTGWAGDDRGISAVRVFLDGELVGLADFAWDRPDVSTVYPHVRHGTDRHGWEATVVTLPGTHAVHVEAVDIDGATSDLGSRRLIVADRSS